MRKEYIVKEAKDYLIYVHDNLRRAFKNGDEGKPFVDSAMTEIEKSVKQLEALEEMLALWKKLKGKKLEMIETEE